MNKIPKMNISKIINNWIGTDIDCQGVHRKVPIPVELSRQQILHVAVEYNHEEVREEGEYCYPCHQG